MLIQALGRLPGQVVVFILKQLAANFARCFLKSFLTPTDRLAAALSKSSNLKKIKELVERGRTDAWIAHSLEISGTELLENKVELGLAEPPPVDESLDMGEPVDEPANEPEPASTAKSAKSAKSEKPADKGKSEKPASGTGYEASFEHGETDGYGLWLDPAVQDDPVYKKHWSKCKSVVVSIEDEKIIIRPST